ncbi:hypothetical protein IKF84_01770 [Candidatus Saccharibacteria bacterium]|nr:hypothetical protein [Candidatus Saccharibacteria bacterium]
MVSLVKDIKIGKRAMITQAQQYMILAVFGATLFLGAAIAVVMKSVTKIGFSASVIMAEDQSIVSFSNAIRDIGICPKPKGEVYTDDELKKCSPDTINVSSIPGTLRYEILKTTASNKALESVANQSKSSCVNPKTGKNYTYSELEKNYDDAGEDEEKLIAAGNLIRTCSALRVIPDALPTYKNEEALLASVDQIFRDSGTTPESLRPTEESGLAGFGNNLYTISVRLSIETGTKDIHVFLRNVEHSIRNFNIDRATISWGSNSSIEFSAFGTAYYMEPSSLLVSTKTIKPGGK